MEPTAVPQPEWGRSAMSMVASLALVASLFGVLAVVAAPSASAAPPQLGQPDVLPAVDLNSLNPTPIKQWGVVDPGNNTALTYSTRSKVWDFLEIGNRIYVAGAFVGAQKDGVAGTPITPQAYLAAFDRDSGEFIASFTPQLNRAVYALAKAPDGNLLVGGEFTTVNGAARTGLVKLNPTTGATVANFTASIGATDRPMVRDIVSVGSQIYVAGQISRIKINGVDQPFVFNAARLSGTTGAFDTTWRPRFNTGGVWQLAIDQTRGRVHAVGYFQAVNEQPNTRRFGTVTLATGASVGGLAAFTFNAPGQQEDMVAVVYADNKIFVGGAQHIVEVLNADNNTLIGYQTAGMSNNGFYPDGYGGGGDFQTLEVTADGQVIGGCHCYGPQPDRVQIGEFHTYSSFSNQRTNNRFAIPFSSASGAVTSGFIPGLARASVGTYAIFVDSKGCYYVGGDYIRSSAGASVGGFGRFCSDVTAPTGVTTTSSNGAATVRWTAAASQLPIKYYSVYVDGVRKGDLTNLASLSYGLGSYPVGSTHTVSIEAVDVTLRRSARSSVTFTVAAGDTTPPSVPTNLTVRASGTSALLTWGASTDNAGGVGMSAYLIVRGGSSVGRVAAGVTTFTDAGLTKGTTYSYQLIAVDKRNNWSARTAAVKVTIGASIDTIAPSVPTAFNAVISGTSVTLTWGASTDNAGGVGLNGYMIHRDFVYQGPIKTTTSFTDTGLVRGRTYRYVVRAVDKNGNQSAKTTALTVTIP